jgi:hypothetical protein
LTYEEKAISPAAWEIKKHAVLHSGANDFRLGMVPQISALVELCHFECRANGKLNNSKNLRALS